MRIIPLITNEYYDVLLNHSNEFLLKNDYFKRDGKLYFKVPAFGIHRKSYSVQVIAPRDRIAVLQRLYDVTKNKLGRDTFYLKLREMYCNISREYAFDFLKKQEVYQLHLIQPREKLLRPMSETKINSRWQMDHIDMSKYSNPRNHNCKWVLVVIDVFSKYVFVRPATKKSAEYVKRDLRDILIDNYEITGSMPAIIQSDNAGEYKSKLIGKYMKEKGIKQIFSPTYMPQAQGIVERFNRTLKNGIFTNFTKQGNNQYYDIIQKIVEDYNNTVHSALKDTPARVHNSNRKNNIQIKLVEKHNEQFTRVARKYTALSIGDKVRVHILTKGDERKNEKFAKKFLPQWSVQIYEVFKIEGEQSAKVKPKYTLVDEGGDALVEKYYRHDLQKIEIPFGHRLL